ncbi:MAG TPA: hypothetical protein VFV72_02890 [Candidatus Limnocylindrales bacterium]|nr:hypothetical protein [Candidatus Limnocylindrales bacterium]
MSAFDRSSRFEHELPDILTAIAVPRVPDYYDDLLAQAAATRQRSRWTFLERWPGMDAIAYRVPVPSLPLRPLIVAALLVALVAAALLIAGSQHRIPPPFGPARNGALLFGDGDIYLRDGIDGTSTLILGGLTDDFAAGFTRDGEHLTFLRRVSGTPGSSAERLQIFVAKADGSDPVAVTEPLVAPDWADYAPDDSFAVVAAGTPWAGQHLFIADFRNPGTLRSLNVGDRSMTMSTPNFLGPTGAELVFRGRTVTGDGVRFGLFAVKPDGSGLRPLTPTDGTDRNMSYSFPQPSPDGRYIAYTAFDPKFNGLRVHLVDVRTGEDRTLTDVGRSEGWAVFSPDSTKIAFLNQIADRQQVFVASVDGTGRLPMGPAYRVVNNESLSSMFSPDGTLVVVTDSASKETRIVDAATGGDGTVLPWSAADLSGWQRLAP